MGNNKNYKMAKFSIISNQKLKKRIVELEKIILKINNFQEILTKKEICEDYKISPKTFDRYKSEGLKHSQAKRNAKIFVKRTDYEKFIATKKW